MATRVGPAFDDLVRKPAVRVLGRWPIAALWLGVALGSLALVAWWLVGALWQTGIAGKETGDPFALTTGQFLLGVIAFPLTVAFLVALCAVIGVGLSFGFDRLIARRASGAAARDNQGDAEIGVVGGAVGVVIVMLFVPLTSVARAIESGRVPPPTDGHWLAGLGGTAVVLLLTWVGLSSALVLLGRTARGS